MNGIRKQLLDGGFTNRQISSIRDLFLCTPTRPAKLSKLILRYFDYYHGFSSQNINQHTWDCERQVMSYFYQSEFGEKNA